MSAAEFALVLPILILFSTGTIEYSRLILLTQKLQSGSFLLADLTARDKTLSTQQLGYIFLAIDQVIQPFEFKEAGRAILTSVGYDTTTKKPKVNWVCSGAGNLKADSQIGDGAGKAATLPTDLAIASGETIIASEIFYSYKPLFPIGPSARVIRRTAYYKPRLGDLSTMACPS